MDTLEEEFRTPEDAKKWLVDTRNVPESVAAKVAPALFEGEYVYPSTLLNIDKNDLISLHISAPNKNLLFNKLQQQQQQVQQQQQQGWNFLSEDTKKGLEEMAADHLHKKRTIVLSKACRSDMQDLLSTLELPERGAKWETKPNLSTVTVGTFDWLNCDEDHEENRKAYMQYLDEKLTIPTQTHSYADAKPYTDLLKVTFLREINASRKIAGTTDVVIVKSENVINETLRNNVETLFELKKPRNLASKDHIPEVVIEHFAASYLNRSHPVVSVLTDLINSWTFFWYAKADDGKMTLFKLKLSGEKAATEAKYILDSVYDDDDVLQEKNLPITFSRRLSFQEVFVDWVKKNTSKHGREEEEEENIEDDDDDDHSTVRPKRSRNRMGNAKNSEPSSSNGRGSSSGSGGTSNSGNQYNASMSMASMLSQFAPPSSRDVANELDLLDMVDEDEQYEIVRSFAMKHVLPYMRG